MTGVRGIAALGDGIERFNRQRGNVFANLGIASRTQLAGFKLGDDAPARSAAAASV